MKNVTIKQMIAHSAIPATLIRAVVRQFGGFDSFKECVKDVTSNGIDGGFHGFIYYTDTCAFYVKHRKDIVELAKQQASEYGEGLLEMIGNFGCLRKSDYSQEEIGQTLFSDKRQHDTQIANALAWYAGEEVCRLYCDLTEEN